MSDLYERDIVVWSEQQAALLRRVAAGDRMNDAHPDWPNIIEEIEDVGRSQVSSVQSLLVEALVHMLKAEAWPLSRDVPHWRSEARIARINAADAYAPSMRQKIDVADIYAKALRAMPETSDGQAPMPLPTVCTVTLDELLSE